MSFLFLPSQLSRRAEFYQQLSQLTAAGVGLAGALTHLHRSPPARSYRQPLRQVLDGLTSGFTFSEALRHLDKPWLPDFDVALIQAGEYSGRLDGCFTLLGEYYAERARMAWQIVIDLAYPSFLLHFFIFIVPFPSFFIGGDWRLYVLRTVGVLVPIYCVVLVAMLSSQSRHGERWRSFMERLLHPVPLLGAGRRALALSRLAAALEALLSAGVTVVEAWESAAAACGSPALARAVRAWRPQVDGGVTPAEAVTASGVFPSLFCGQYGTGEISGQLEDTLKRLQRYYQDEGTRKMRALSRWFPLFLYLAIVIMIACYIVRFYTQQYQGFFKLLNLEQ